MRTCSLDAVVELLVLLQEVVRCQSTSGEETEGDRRLPLRLDTPACSGSEQCDTASQCGLGAVVLVLLEEVS